MLQQHQVGALFGLFVRAIGAARFVRAIAPVAALVAVASIPLPRAATSIDASAPSSGLVQVLAVAQRATSRSHDFALSVEASHPGAAQAAQRGVAGNGEGGSAFARIGDRWLQLRAATQRVEDASPRHVGDRLLHAATSRAVDAWAPETALEAFALLGDTLKPVAFTGAEPRAPPAAASQSNDAGDPQPASAKEIAGATPATNHDSAAAGSGAASATSAASRSTKTPPDSLSPLKLSDEQRNISRFVARRYRVNLDDVQHFVAHAYRAASEFRLDPHLVLAVMSIESSFNPNARSSAGAQGLMQVLTRVHLDKFAPFGGARAALDPMANITVGSRILKEYLVREGTVEGALKSYVGAALLPHDFGYGSKVLGERARIAAAARNETIPHTITARAGGRTTKIAMAEQQRAGKVKASAPAGDARPAQQKAQASGAPEAGRAQAPSRAPASEAASTLVEAQASEAAPTSAEARTPAAAQTTAPAQGTEAQATQVQATQAQATQVQATKAQATQAQATQAQATQAQATQAQATQVQATQVQATEAQTAQAQVAQAQAAAPARREAQVPAQPDARAEAPTQARTDTRADSQMRTPVQAASPVETKAAPPKVAEDTAESLPAQASEPRASSTSVLVPSQALREL